jgi:hypothetical protein
MLWRQGDVLIAQVDSIPDNAVFQPQRTLLVEGEITGHAHRIEFPENAAVWEYEGVLYMKVKARDTRIVHEEHKPITLPEGVYRVWRQREYSPRAIRTVAD